MTGLDTAMILAGGRGSRLAPLTDRVPKPMLPLVGMPFLEGLIRRLAGFDITRALLIVGADPAPFAVLEERAAQFGVDVEVLPETEPLDTAGGVRAALDRVDRTFLVLNGDVLTGFDLRELVAHHQRHEAVATLALTRVEDTSAFGVCVCEGERIVDFVEKPAPGSLPGQDTVNAGTYVLEPEALTRFPLGPLSFEREVFPRLVAEGHRVVGWVSDAVWADLGTAERYLEGHRLVLDGAVDWPTVAAANDTTLDGDVEVAGTAELRAPVWVGAGARVGPRAIVGPYTVLGPACEVGADAVVAGTVVHEGGVVGRGARIQDAVLGAGARVAAGAEPAAGALIGPGQRGGATGILDDPAARTAR